MALYIGIDPGSSGALCALDPSVGIIEFHPTPNEAKGIYPIDVFDWLGNMGQQYGPVRMTGIEKVHSIQGMSAKSNFTFGFNVGMLHVLVRVNGYPMDLVPPLEWQRAIKAPSRKKAGGPKALKVAIAGIANRLYPSAPLRGPKGGVLDGRADALMIAHHLSQKHP